MPARHRALVVLAGTALLSCAAPPPPPPPPKPVVVLPPTDTVRIPLIDLPSYFKSRGGLYPNGLNQASADTLGARAARTGSGLDVTEMKSFGKYVLISIGCRTPPRSGARRRRSACGRGPHGRASADLTVNKSRCDRERRVGWGRTRRLDLSASRTTSDQDGRLAHWLSENQVEAAWVKLDDAKAPRRFRRQR